MEMQPQGGPQHPRTSAAVIEAVGAIELPRFQLPSVELQVALHEKTQEIFARARKGDWPAVDRQLGELRLWVGEQRVAAEEHWAAIRAKAAESGGDPDIFPARLMDPPDGIGVGDYLSGRMYDTEVKEENA